MGIFYCAVTHGLCEWSYKFGSHLGDGCHCFINFHGVRWSWMELPVDWVELYYIPVVSWCQWHSVKHPSHMHSHNSTSIHLGGIFDIPIIFREELALSCPSACRPFSLKYLECSTKVGNMGSYLYYASTRVGILTSNHLKLTQCPHKIIQTKLLLTREKRVTKSFLDVLNTTSKK